MKSFAWMVKMATTFAKSRYVNESYSICVSLLMVLLLNFGFKIPIGYAHYEKALLGLFLYYSDMCNLFYLPVFNLCFSF